MAPVQRGKLKPSDAKKITQNYKEIIDNIDSVYLTPQLLSQGVINEDDKDAINTKATRRDRAQALADRMLNAGCGENYALFIKILKEDYPDLAAQIESTDVSQELIDEKISLSEEVKSLPFTDVHASQISSHIGRGWQHLMLQLGLNSIKIDREKQQNGDGSTITLTNLIIQWRRKEGKAATWGKMFSTLEDVKDLTDVDLVAVKEIAMTLSQS